MFVARSNSRYADAGKKHNGGVVVTIVGARPGVGARTLTASIGAILTRRGLRVATWVDDDALAETADADKRQSSDTLSSWSDADAARQDESPGNRSLLAQAGLVSAGNALRGLTSSRLSHDVVLVSGMTALTAARVGMADVVAVVITTAPSVLVDGYLLLKGLRDAGSTGRWGVIVNGAESAQDADRAARRLERTVRLFLGRPLENFGNVPLDRHVPQAKRDGQPVTRRYPRCAASAALATICARLVPRSPLSATPAPLWTRLAALFL